MRGERIEQFIREDAAGGDCERNFGGAGKMSGRGMNCESLGMLRAARRGTLHGDIFERGIKRGKFAHGEIQYVASQASNARSRLHHNKWARRTKKLPHFRELPGEQSPKYRMNIHAGVVVAKAPGAYARIISVLGMIETLA